MTPADRWDRALRILGAIGGTAVVRTNKRGGCAIDVWVRNRVEGCLGQIRAASEAGLFGQEAIEQVIDECAEKIEEQARRVYAELVALLEGGGQ